MGEKMTETVPALERNKIPMWWCFNWLINYNHWLVSWSVFCVLFFKVSFMWHIKWTVFCFCFAVLELTLHYELLRGTGHMFRYVWVATDKYNSLWTMQVVSVNGTMFLMNNYLLFYCFFATELQNSVYSAIIPSTLSASLTGNLHGYHPSCWRDECII